MTDSSRSKVVAVFREAPREDVPTGLELAAVAIDYIAGWARIEFAVRLESGALSPQRRVSSWSQGRGGGCQDLLGLVESGASPAAITKFVLANDPEFGGFEEPPTKEAGEPASDR